MIGAQTLLATVTFRPEGLLGWIIVGLIAGWLANKLMGDGGMGLLGDIVVGLVGALIGGFVVGLLWSGSVGLIGSIVVAVIGACMLIWLLRAVSGGRVAPRVRA